VLCLIFETSDSHCYEAEQELRDAALVSGVIGGDNCLRDCLQEIIRFLIFSSVTPSYPGAASQSWVSMPLARFPTPIYQDSMTCCHMPMELFSLVVIGLTHKRVPMLQPCLLAVQGVGPTARKPDILTLLIPSSLSALLATDRASYGGPEVDSDCAMQQKKLH